MKVLLIYPDVLYHRGDWSGYFYLGLGSISAVLKREGHDTALLHIARKPLTRDQFLARVEREKPDLIGFSSTSHMFGLVKEMAAWLAEARIGVPVICGGIQPTIAPEEVIATKGIEMICRGEGEEPMVELCRQLSHGQPVEGIENLWFRKGEQIVRNRIRPPISNLDVLPYPDRSIFDYPTLYLERKGSAMFMASRGCPYSCSYCCNHLLRKINGNGKAVRFRSVEHLLGEIREARRQFPFIRSLVFDDDILFLKPRWSAEFAERYPAEIGLPFHCNARADLTNKTIVALMKKAGCTHVKFGLESGNEDISNRILNRGLNNDQIRRAFALCKAAGLSTESFNMVGVPCDTVSTILDTVKLNAEIRADRMQITIFQPYHGTKLATLCQEQHWLKEDPIGTDFLSGSILNLPGITRAQVLMLRDSFIVLVWLYRLIRHLPASLARRVVALTDRLLGFRATARLLIIAHAPLYCLRKVAYLARMKVEMARQKRVVAACGLRPLPATTAKEV